MSVQRAAVVVVVRRAGSILVIQRGPTVPRSGYWAPLSGKVETGERQDEAVVREADEEVGLSVVPERSVWECDTDDGAYRLYWWTAAAYSAELVLQPAEVAAARWIRPEEFTQLAPTFASDREFFTVVYPRLGLDDRSSRAG